MGLLDWLKAKIEGHAVEDAHHHMGEGEDSMGGLDMKTAIDAHVGWVRRMNALVEGSAEEHIDIAQVSRDDACTLGKWLYHEGKAVFGALPEYEKLRASHAEFHLRVGEVCICHNRGEIARATQLAHRELRDLSDQVQLDIVRLYSRAQGHSTPH